MKAVNKINIIQKLLKKIVDSWAGSLISSSPLVWFPALHFTLADKIAGVFYILGGITEVGKCRSFGV